eukprot:scaffold168855_cov22-Tisochrysis_lutea.AAC.1
MLFFPECNSQPRVWGHFNQPLILEALPANLCQEHKDFKFEPYNEWAEVAPIPILDVLGEVEGFGATDHSVWASLPALSTTAVRFVHNTRHRSCPSIWHSVPVTLWIVSIQVAGQYYKSKQRQTSVSMQVADQMSAAAAERAALHQRMDLMEQQHDPSFCKTCHPLYACLTQRIASWAACYASGVGIKGSAPAPALVLPEGQCECVSHWTLTQF